MALGLPESAILHSKKTQEVYTVYSKVNFLQILKIWFVGILKWFKGCLMGQEEHKMAAEDVKGFKIKDTRFYSRILESSKKWRCSNWANPARPKKQYKSRDLWSPKF